MIVSLKGHLMEVGVVLCHKDRTSGCHRNGVDPSHRHQGGIMAEDLNLRGHPLEVEEFPLMMDPIGNREPLKGPLDLVKIIHPHQALHHLSIVTHL